MINSIASNGIKPMTYSRTDKSNDTQIKVLRQQESSIQKQIDSIKDSKQDPKTKQELIEPLEAQIQSIEGQIQQVEIDQVSNKNDNVSNKNDNVSSSSAINSESNEKLLKDNMFLSMSSTYKQVTKVNSVRKNLLGKANELNSDAELDEMLENYQMAKIERVEASEDQGKANGLQAKIGKLSHDMDKSVKNEISKENKIENIKSTDSEDLNEDYEKNPKKASEESLKDGAQDNFDDNKKQSINVLV